MSRLSLPKSVLKSSQMLLGKRSFVHAMKTLPVVEGHRCAGRLQPENTLLALRFAHQYCRVDSVEIDVWKTSDNHCVVIHGSETGEDEVHHTTNGVGNVSDLTLAQIQSFDAGKGEVVPTLDEFLRVSKTIGVHVNIEVKNSEIGRDIADAVNKINAPATISSFDLEFLGHVKSNFPSIPVGALFDEREAPNQDSIVKMVDYAETVAICYSDVTHDVVKSCHEIGKRLTCWIPIALSECEDDLLKLIEAGVDGICTNRPDVMRRLIADRSSLSSLTGAM